MRECNLGDLVTDAMVEFYMKKYSQTSDSWTDAAISVYNSGGIRATIDKRAEGGNITLEDLLSVVPFGNYMVILVMSGKH